MLGIIGKITGGGSLQDKKLPKKRIANTNDFLNTTTTLPNQLKLFEIAEEYHLCSTRQIEENLK